MSQNSRKNWRKATYRITEVDKVRSQHPSKNQRRPIRMKDVAC